MELVSGFSFRILESDYQRFFCKLLLKSNLLEEHKSFLLVANTKLILAVIVVLKIHTLEQVHLSQNTLFIRVFSYVKGRYELSQSINDLHFISKLLPCYRNLKDEFLNIVYSEKNYKSRYQCKC